MEVTFEETRAHLGIETQSKRKSWVNLLDYRGLNISPFGSVFWIICNTFSASSI
jgi:hypothetical protein